jgi:hypothetical protein
MGLSEKVFQTADEESSAEFESLDLESMGYSKIQDGFLYDPKIS